MLNNQSINHGHAFTCRRRPVLALQDIHHLHRATCFFQQEHTPVETSHTTVAVAEETWLCWGIYCSKNTSALLLHTIGQTYTETPVVHETSLCEGTFSSLSSRHVLHQNHLHLHWNLLVWAKLALETYFFCDLICTLTGTLRAPFEQIGHISRKHLHCWSSTSKQLNLHWCCKPVF